MAWKIIDGQQEKVAFNEKLASQSPPSAAIQAAPSNNSWRVVDQERLRGIQSEEEYEYPQNTWNAEHAPDHPEYHEGAPFAQTAQKALKIGARGVARAASTLLGAGGDAAALALTGGHYASRGARAIGEKFGLDLPEIPSYSQYREQNPEDVALTGNEIFESLNKRTGGYLTPETESEKKLDDFVGDITGFLNPAFGSMKISKAAKLAGLGNAASWLAETAGINETGQTAAKIGSIFLYGLPGMASRLVNLMKESYQAADRAVPIGATIPSRDLGERMAKLEQKLTSGIPTEAKEELLKSVNEINKKIPREQIPLTKINKYSQELPVIISELTLRDKPIRHLYEKLDTEINNLMNAYKKNKPEFPEAIIEPIKLGAKKLEDILSDVSRRAFKGRQTPARKELQKYVSSMQKDIQKYELPVIEAREIKRNINEILRKVPESEKYQRQILGEMVGDLNTSLANYGKTNKPFYKNFKRAESLSSGKADADKFVGFLKSDSLIAKAVNSVESPLAKLIIGGLAAAKSGQLNPKIAGVAAAIGGVRELARIGRFMKTTPMANRAYKGLLRAGLHNNKRIAIKEIQKLDKLAKHYEKKEKN